MKFILAFFLSLPFIANAQTGISGTITHAFGAGAPGKPDAGAKVYVFKYDGDAAALYETINNFLLAKEYRRLNGDVGRLTTIYKDSADVIKGKKKYEAQYAAFMAKIAGLKTDAEARTAQLQGLSAGTNQQFDALDQQTAKAVSQAKLRAADMRAIADAGGNYTISLSPGNYAVLLMSNNRTGFTSTEVYGRIQLQQVAIRAGEMTDVSAKFTPDK